MKKLALTFALVISLVSCSPDDDSRSNQEPAGCNCDRISEVQTITYNQATGVFTTTPWQTIATVSNFTNDCTRNGQITSGTQSQSGNVAQHIRYRIVCR